MRVIGIDPGLRNLGWGVVDVIAQKLATLVMVFATLQRVHWLNDCWNYIIN